MSKFLHNIYEAAKTGDFLQGVEVCETTRQATNAWGKLIEVFEQGIGKGRLKEMGRKSCKVGLESSMESARFYTVLN